MRNQAIPLRRDKKGATSLEYALIAALIAVFTIVGAKKFGKNESKSYTTIEKSFKPRNLHIS